MAIPAPAQVTAHGRRTWWAASTRPLTKIAATINTIPTTTIATSGTIHGAMSKREMSCSKPAPVRVFDPLAARRIRAEIVPINARPTANEAIAATHADGTAGDASARLNSLYGVSIDASRQGRWEALEESPGCYWVTYVSPMLTNGKGNRIYVVLEYRKEGFSVSQFETYKFFSEGEDYRDNHR